MIAVVSWSARCGIVGVPLCRSTQANKYSQQELLLMKTQDVKYLDTKSRSEAAVGRGHTMCVFGGGGGFSKHSAGMLAPPLYNTLC